MDRLKGIIDKYVYYNESDGYSVIRLTDSTVIVGYLPKLNSDDEIQVSGNWIFHSKYGKQFKIEKFSIVYPSTKEGLVKYLGSGLIKGIGKITANKIVDFFGDRTLNMLENSIDELIKVPTIGKKKLEVIKQSWEKQKGIKDIMIFLQSHNVSPNFALKIYKKYGEATIPMVENNPYRLVGDIWGIGFKTADSIGKSLGFGDSHPLRIKAGIIYALTEASNNGHVYLPKEELIRYCSGMLNFELEINDPVFEELLSEDQIVEFQSNIYLWNLYTAEREIENALKNFLHFSKEITYKQQKILSLLNSEFSEEQLDAIRLALVNKILIVTGGPGTGKTTTIRGIINAYIKLGKKTLLAAPTGRAAKRMTELIGIEAKTIHRLLEYNPMDNSFNYNKENQLKTDLLVIDELSMIDTLLMFNFITAIDVDTTLVFVGDTNQLPSVGAGNILNDLISCNEIPVIKLTKIFRQAEKSKIVLSAHKINKGIIPEISNEEDSDLFFLEENDITKIPSLILDLYQNRISKKYGFNPLTDIQVISPMYKGAVGVNNLNRLIQKEFNKNPVIYSAGEKHYKIKDKVMQLRNNYIKNVFNGDIGYIEGIDLHNKKMQIIFDNRLVIYEFEELDEITLSYACTVHKSQGSEFPCVIMPLTTTHYIMLQRNLLYTAITRASKLLVLIGSKQAFAIAVNNNKVILRFTSLMK